jgi:hypothetical protein
MADELPDDVKILPPDNSLAKKIGNVDLNKLFSSEAVEKAQTVIVAAASTFMDEAKSAIVELKSLVESFGKSQNTGAMMPQIVKKSFFIKTRLGSCGYELVAEIAKSLENYAENLKSSSPSAKDISIIHWHVQSIEMLMQKDIKGSGGAVGDTIKAEMRQLAPAATAKSA